MKNKREGLSPCWQNSGHFSPHDCVTFIKINQTQKQEYMHFRCTNKMTEDIVSRINDAREKTKKYR